MGDLDCPGMVDGQLSGHHHVAGLQEFPGFIIAAEIDGANKMQIFFKVTLPLLSRRSSS
ncbi:MAG: hypothetical protein ACLVJ6_10575 [Merdibacter sp.]